MLQWDELKRACAACQRGGLCQTRHNVVFGVGIEDADILLIGEGPGEQERCQVALVKPKIIVCLGRIAAKRLIDPDYRITRQHGTWVEKNGVWMTAIYHPSALLRDVSKRPETFEDLLSIREKIREVGARV